MEDPKYKLFEQVIYKSEDDYYTVGIISDIRSVKNENGEDCWFYRFMFSQNGARGEICEEKEIIKKI